MWRNIQKKNFKTHFKICKELIYKYRDFDFKMIQLLKKYLSSKKSFFIIKFFLQRYIKILNNHLNNKLNNIIKKTNIKEKELKNSIPFNPIKRHEKKKIINYNNNNNNISPILNTANKSNIEKGIGINNFNPIYAESENNNNNFFPIKNPQNSFNKKGIGINNFNPIYAENENPMNLGSSINEPDDKHSFEDSNPQMQFNRTKASNYEDINANNLKKSESQINLNAQIEIKFNYEDTPLTYREKGKLNEKLIEIIKRFEKGNCPNWMKKHLSNPTYNGKKIDPQNTLYEIGIKNLEKIVFVKIKKIIKIMIKLIIKKKTKIIMKIMIKLIIKIMVIKMVLKIMIKLLIKIMITLIIIMIRLLMKIIIIIRAIR